MTLLHELKCTSHVRGITCLPHWSFSPGLCWQSLPPPFFCGGQPPIISKTRHAKHMSANGSGDLCSGGPPATEDLPSKATCSDLSITFKKKKKPRYWPNQPYLQRRSRQLFVLRFEFLGSFLFVLLGKHKGKKVPLLDQISFKNCLYFLNGTQSLKPLKVTSAELSKPFPTWQLLIQESSEDRC